MTMLSNLVEPYQESFIKYDGEIETLYDDNKRNNAYRKFYFESENGKIFFMEDSFSDAMKPMISRTFEYSDFVHRDTKIFDEVLKEKPDIFVYEMVKRYVPRLEKSVF